MTDTKKILTCPACGKEMKKIFIEEKNINIDICVDGCGGIFFDNRELQMFDEKNENADDIFAELENKTFIEVNEDDTRVCPVCGMNMVKNFSSINKKIKLDECYGCGGKFLDNNKLQLIREEFENDTERTLAVQEYTKNTIGNQLAEAANYKRLNRNTTINAIAHFFAGLS